tara:strand:- start:2020 stop:2922 length:903 start_codon:yes stop_codon:yes gene_type:complete
MAGKYSAMSSISQITVPTKTSAPGNVTSHSATSDPISITIKWTNPSDTDLKAVEIYYSTSSGSGFSLLASVDGVPGTVNEFNWNYEDTLSLNQTYYFKLRAVNTSLVAGSYTTEINAQFSTIGTGDVTMNAISNISGSIVSYNSNAESTTQDAITYSANGTGSDSTTFNGYMAAEITLGAIDSSIAGFLITANALASKRTIGTAKYAYAIVLQKLPSNAYWTKSAASGNYAVFLGTGDATGQSSTEGIQGSFSSSFLDDATGVTGTTGSKYGLFLYEPTETTDQYWVFGGTGLTVTELKR